MAIEQSGKGTGMFRRGREACRKVAIVVPLSRRNSLTESEELCLRHIDHYLGDYDRYLISPKSIDFEYGSYRRKVYAERFFGSCAAHGRLCLSRDLYLSFQEYDYILFAHLDSLVFSSDLEHWCDAGFDFIGAPWISGPDLPWLQNEAVGNGGFSLRKVQSFLALLGSRAPWRRWRDSMAAARGLYRKGRKTARHLLHYRNGIGGHIQHFLKRGGNEDIFISRYANHYSPSFRIAPVDVALNFAFEANPRICFDRNGQHRPFGCHAWEKYDRSFWEPYLLLQPESLKLRRGLR